MEITIKGSAKEIAELLVEVEAQPKNNSKKLIHKFMLEATKKPSDDFLKLLRVEKE